MLMEHLVMNKVRLAETEGDYLESKRALLRWASGRDEGRGMRGVLLRWIGARAALCCAGGAVLAWL